jgi:hypothetical protein
MTRRIHRDQLGVVDQMADEQQLQERHRGIYDPRRASGDFVAVRVKVLCRSCGRQLFRAVDFEHRTLYEDLVADQWVRAVPLRFCPDCPPRPPKDATQFVARLAERVQEARRMNRTKVVKKF